MRSFLRFNLLGLLALGAYFLFLLDPSYLQGRTVFYIFQSRDLARALELFHGHFLLYGPEVTGGGNLPGPFYYLLLSIFLRIQPVWQAAWWGMVLLAGAGAAAMFYFLRANALLIAALLWLPFYLDSAHTQHLFTIFMNPSYLFFFVILQLICACLITGAQNEKTRGRAFLAASLITGLAIQVHFSSIFPYLAIIFMQLAAGRLKIPRLRKSYLFLGVGLFVMPLAPFLIWKTLHCLGYEVGEPEPYTGQFSSAGLIYVSLAKGWSGRVALKESLRVFPWTLPLLLGAVYAGGARDKDSQYGGRFIKPLLICAAFAFIPFSYIYFVPIGNRYGVPLNLSLILVTVILQCEVLNRPRRLNIFNGLALVMLIAVWTWSYLAYPENIGDAGIGRLLITAVVSGGAFVLLDRQAKFRREKIIALILAVAVSHAQRFVFAKNELPVIQDHLIHNHQWRRIWKRIGRMTGWSYETARERIYFVNAHIDEDPAPGFIPFEKTPDQRKRNEKTPDGFFVALNVPEGAAFRDWLLEEPIADEIKEGLRRGEISLGEAEDGRIAVVPYFILRNGRLPDHFHDIGLGYERDPAAAAFDQIRGSEGAAKIAENQYLFKWNECPDGHRYCDQGAVVTLDAGNLRVKILGSALSQVSPWIHPQWTQALDEPYVDVKCGGETKSFILAKSVGYKRRYSLSEPVTGFFAANNSLVAPYEREFNSVCRGKIEELSFGRKSSSVDNVLESKTLPAKKLSLKLF